MTEEPETIADTPGQLLSATHDLALRVRRAQRGTWFPLVLLGLVVIGAAPVYRFGSGGRVSCGTTHGPGGEVLRTCFFSYGWPAFIYWMIVLVLAYAVIAGFYLLRARKRGVGSRVRPYVTAGIAGLIKVILTLRHGEIPPHLHLQQPNPHIPWAELPLDVPTQLTPWPKGDGPRRAGIRRSRSALRRAAR